MAPRRRFQFTAETRADLRHHLGNDEEAINELEQAAQWYRHAERVHKRLAKDIPKVERDLKRIHALAKKLLSELDKAHPVVQALTRKERSAVEVLARRNPRRDGPKVNNARRDLEYTVGHVLDRHGTQLSVDGQFADVLGIVFNAVMAKAPGPDGLRLICRRVRDEIAAAKQAISDLTMPESA